jgi:peptidoglycan hydrolase-like protein with peptidoglycan-binding domain
MRTRGRSAVTAPHSLLSLQRLAGNAAVLQLVTGGRLRSSTMVGTRDAGFVPPVPDVVPGAQPVEAPVPATVGTRPAANGEQCFAVGERGVQEAVGDHHGVEERDPPTPDVVSRLPAGFVPRAEPADNPPLWRLDPTRQQHAVPALQRTVGRLLQRSVEQEGAPGKRPDLVVGDSGPGVALLQRMLGVTGTGVFDQQTRKAVDRFQRQQGWDPSGVGPETWKRLDNHAGAPAQRPNLVEGDRGPGVRLLQQMLGLTGTGFFGPATRTAVDTFQKAQKWDPSGVGPMTWAALDKSTGNKVGPVDTQGGDWTGALLVGGKFIGDVSKFEKGGRVALRGADLVAKGVRATIGATEIAKDAVVAVEVAGGAGAGAGLVTVIGVAALGAAVGVGIGLSPIAVAHAQEVADQLGEFGRVSAPGGKDPGSGPCPQCKNVHRGTTPNYGMLDDFLRPRGITALLKGKPDPGTPTDRSIEPPGWTGGGKDLANQARTHLLGQALGGSGSERRNLVTFDQGANVRMFNEFERETIDITSTSDPATCFKYIVTPEYIGSPKSPTDRSALMPHRITATLVDLCTDAVLINHRSVDNLLPH